MTSSIYNQKWIHYKDQCEAEALLEDIWSGRYVQADLILEADYQKQLLEEGVISFFSNAYNAVKGKIEDLATWADNKLQSFIDAGLTKLQEFLQFLRGRGVLKKYEARGMSSVVGVFKRPEYLQAGAAMIMILIQKLAELGAKALMDMMTGGSTALARSATWVQQNIEKVKLFIEAIKNFFDPEGIIDLIANAWEGSQTFKQYADILIKLKADLKNPMRDFESAFSAMNIDTTPDPVTTP